MELEHIQQVGQLLQEYEGKDIHSIFPADVLPLIVFEPNKEYVRNIVNTQRNLQPLGREFKRKEQLPPEWSSYRDTVNREGVPSQQVVEMMPAPA